MLAAYNVDRQRRRLRRPEAGGRPPTPAPARCPPSPRPAAGWCPRTPPRPCRPCSPRWSATAPASPPPCPATRRPARPAPPASRRTSTPSDGYLDEDGNYYYQSPASSAWSPAPTCRSSSCSRSRRPRSTAATWPLRCSPTSPPRPCAATQIPPPALLDLGRALGARALAVGPRGRRRGCRRSPTSTPQG